MPHLIYQACLKTGCPSNSHYMNLALVSALSRDLGLDEAGLLDALPPSRGPAAHLYNPDEHTMARYPVHQVHDGGRHHVGPGNTHEEVR